MDTQPPSRLRIVLDELAERLYEAIEAASPLCSYPEIKDVLAAEYYRYVIKMRRDHGLTWREVALPAGMTPQGIQKLGDKRAVKEADSPLRRMLDILQDAGDDGLSAGELAGRFYENLSSPSGEDLTFDEILDALEAGGEARHREGRWTATEPRTTVTLAAARDVLVILHGAGPHGMTFAELASDFYENRRPHDRTDLAQVMRLLRDAGDVNLQDGRYHTTGTIADLSKEGGVSDRTVRSIVQTASRIGAQVRDNSGRHDAQLFRISFHIPDDDARIPDILRRIQQAVLDVIVETEAQALDSGAATRQMTVIHGAAPGLP